MLQLLLNIGKMIHMSNIGETSANAISRNCYFRCRNDHLNNSNKPPTIILVDLLGHRNNAF
jgi:hypothetical protein